MRVPNRVFARRHLRVDSRHFYAWKNNKAVPDGAILYYNADYSARRELTRYGHKLEALILGDQYEIQPDGASLNIGAKVPVDTFGREKWLRSCGAVTNLLPSGSLDFLSNRWEKRGVTPILNADGSYRVVLGNGGTKDLFVGGSVVTANPHIHQIYAKRVSGTADLKIRDSVGSVGNDCTLVQDEWILCSVLFASTGQGPWLSSSDGSDLTVDLRLPLSANVSYPLPYTPPGTTMPASNATTTNGSWFTLADGSPVWKALTGQPLTLATRVRMGVGSGDIVGATANKSIVSWRGDEGDFGFRSEPLEADIAIVRSYDSGGGQSARVKATWNRGAIVYRFLQVGVSGARFRVGYMIEGIHTTPQWSHPGDENTWSTYDGSFNPSTLYRLMLGFNNAYPMWFNKIVAWKKQASDTEIMEALS